MDCGNAGRLAMSTSRLMTRPPRFLGGRRQEDVKTARCVLQFIVLNLGHFPNKAGQPGVRLAAPPFWGGGFCLLEMRDRRRPFGSIQRLCHNHAETEAQAKWQQPVESSKRSRHARVPPRMPVLRGPLPERNRSN